MCSLAQNHETESGCHGCILRSVWKTQMVGTWKGRGGRAAISSSGSESEELVVGSAEQSPNNCQTSSIIFRGTDAGHLC
jgi:hypothetical protein